MPDDTPGDEMPITPGPLVGLDALADRRSVLPVIPGAWTADQVKEFVGAILHEKDIALARAIEEGDERLREHVATQIVQINAALTSADKLELERLARVEARLIGLEQLLTAQQSAAETAQLKFEDNVTARFTSVNEFRASLDDLGKLMATRRELEATKATSNERFDDLLRQLSDMRSRLDKGPEGLLALTARADLGQGAELGAQKFRTALFAGLGAVATIIAIVVALNSYSGHSQTPTVTTVTVTVPRSP